MQANWGCRIVGTINLATQWRSVRGTAALADERTCSLSLTARSSLGGVLERGGFLAARLVQELRFVLIRVTRGLDGSLGIGHELTDDRHEALTFSRMLVGVQDHGGFPQGAQITYDLDIGGPAELGLLQDRFFELGISNLAVRHGWRDAAR